MKWQMIFSVPHFALLLIPGLASYSTSLNIIFFYMTWGTLVLSHTYIRIELVSSLVIRILAFIAPSLFLFLFDLLLPSAAVFFKRNGEHGLPCGKKRGGIRVQDIKVAGWAVFNVLFGVFLQAITEYILINLLHWPSALNASFWLPMPWTISLHLVAILVLRDALTWAVHYRILHDPNFPLTGWFAKTHQEWFHSLKFPYPTTANYEHPLVWVVWRFIPTYLPAIAFRVHIVTFIIYLAYVSLEETFVYSGYTFFPAWGLMGGMAKRLEEHMLTDGLFSFGAWGFFDFAFDTARNDDAGEDISRLDSDDFQKQVQKAMDSSKRKIREGTLRRQTRAGGHRRHRDRTAS